MGVLCKNSIAGTARFTVEISSSPSCTCTDFKNNGDASNCVHILFVLVFALKCTDREVLVRRQMSKEEMEKLMAAPLEIPDSIAAKLKAKSKSEMLGIIRNHAAFGIQLAEFQRKQGRKAACKTCKKSIEVGTTCLRVFKAVIVPFNATTDAELRDVSFCAKVSCIQNPPPYVHVVLPQSIPCCVEVPEGDATELQKHFTVTRIRV